MNDFNLASWFINELTGSPDSVVNWRCIHDQRKDIPAHNYVGTLAEQWSNLNDYSSRGYGIFCIVNAMDGAGFELPNVQYIRAHMVDLDDMTTAQANYDRAVQAGASFAVQTSPGKFHVYWKVAPYVGNEFFTIIQRKLAQLYGGDPKVIDATRVMRIPGFVHQKAAPQMVTGWPLSGRVYSYQELETSLSHVNVVEFLAQRSPLGTSDLAAPSFEWLKFAMSLADPNEMDRTEWLSFSAAVKQAGWNHADEDDLFNLWSEWCGQYSGNDAGENLKLWDSIRDSEVGWKSIQRKTPVQAYIDFGHKTPPALKPTAILHGPANVPPEVAALIKSPAPAATDSFGEILSEYECQEWFKDCYFVEQAGKIFSRAGRFMNATQFNGRYGGKQFIVSSTAKLTDEPWKAALRSTCWTIPKVDHIRFLPDRPSFEIVEDALERRGLNTYIPAKIQSYPGDVSIWIDHVTRILPDANDRRIFFEYLAHCVKYPGHKIHWAVLLQSAEGIGKTVFFEVMQHALGDMYVYTPNAQKLVESGSTFNAWQRNKLLIVVNEIKIDERRELIEILKPWITDARIEVQSKGVDQDMEDNAANWLLFSNFKDAVPISQNGRRYSIFYSALQTHADILAAGMDDDYFIRLWGWLRDGGGLQAVAYWLLNYPIERGTVPVRAPHTSSHAEALQRSRSPMEVTVCECVADGVSGFRGGYVSTIAVIAKCKAAGIRQPNSYTVQTCLESMGYVAIGRALRPYMQEDINNRTELYGLKSDMTVDGYGRAQGYE